MEANIDGYYKILNLHKQATLQDLKKQYRTQAKKLHPDNNKHENAHEQFILLNEAYVFLTEYIPNKQKFSSSKYLNHKYSQSKQTAQKYADVNWEKFQHTKLYKSAKVLGYFTSWFFIIMGLYIIFIPIVMFLIFGVESVAQIIVSITSFIVGSIMVYIVVYEKM